MSDYSKDEVMETLKDLYLMLYQIPTEQKINSEAYSSAVMNQAEHIINEYEQENKSATN